MQKKEKVICFDFDGVISTYDGWKGFDILGKPIPEVIEAMKKLKEKGYYIIIFTTRLFTPKIKEWLDKYKVPYDEFNTNKNNPPHTSIKPVYHAFIDDRAVNFNIKTNKLSTEELIKRIEDIIGIY